MKTSILLAAVPMLIVSQARGIEYSAGLNGLLSGECEAVLRDGNLDIKVSMIPELERHLAKANGRPANRRIISGQNQWGLYVHGQVVYPRSNYGKSVQCLISWPKLMGREGVRVTVAPESLDDYYLVPVKNPDLTVIASATASLWLKNPETDLKEYEKALNEASASSERQHMLLENILKWNDLRALGAAEIYVQGVVDNHALLTVIRAKSDELQTTLIRIVNRHLGELKRKTFILDAREMWPEITNKVKALSAAGLPSEEAQFLNEWKDILDQAK